VASSTPSSSATGVSKSTSIAVTFAKAVDKVSAQAAFGITSPNGMNGGVFNWSTDGLTMTYTPPSAFAFGTYVSWQINTALKSLAGYDLPAPVSRSFTVIRQGTTTLYGVAALDGSMWNTDTDPINATYASLYVGDSGAIYERGFLSFDLTSIPATATVIDSATLYAYQSYVSSPDPYAAGLGNLLAQSVDYGTTLTAADFDTPVLTYTGFHCWTVCTPVCRLVCGTSTYNDQYTLSTTASLGWKSVDVTGKVERDRAARTTRGNRCQFRLEFPNNTNGDTVYNAAWFSSGDSASNKPYLNVTYEYP
jgi:hypothetical protein